MSNDLDELLNRNEAARQAADEGATREAVLRLAAIQHDILKHLRSHPAPPPSPSEENAGDLFGWKKCEDCGGSGEAFTVGCEVSNGPCATCNGFGRLCPVKNDVPGSAPRSLDICTVHQLVAYNGSCFHCGGDRNLRRYGLADGAAGRVPSEENAGDGPGPDGHDFASVCVRCGEHRGVSKPCAENAGEVASDGELALVCYGAEKGPTYIANGHRALYDLGKKHQASADAATIAGLQKKLDAAESRVRKLEGLHFRRPEPGGGK